MKRTQSITFLLAMLSLFGIINSSWADDEGLDAVTEFDIPAQSLEAALIRFSEQADIQLVMASATVEGKEAGSVNGALENRTALDTLLAGTGLAYESVNDRTIAVSKQEPTEPGKSQPASSQVLMAQNQTSATQSQTSNSNNANTSTDEDDQLPIPLEEIIVVGSHIRGARSASPLYTFDRENIDRSGFANTQDFIRSIPQNFGGGASEISSPIMTSQNDANLNFASGTGVNLRGLGTDSTLVLLNGRRFASAGFGNFVDISLVPLSAIDRVEVLTDGASATYGSDAVAGVVNFILRDDYEGAETRLRAGTATDGDSDEVLFGQTFGKNWNKGNALISYEYYSRDALDTQDRSFSQEALDPFDLLPKQERHSAFVNAHQDVSDRAKIFGNVFFSVRDSEETHPRQTDFATTAAETEQFGGSLGSSLDFGNTWAAEFVAGYSKNDTARELFVIDTATFDSSLTTQSSIATLDFKADGTLVSLPGGDIRVAVGAQYRTEEFEFAIDDVTVNDEDRDTTAGFVEVFIPIVGDGNRRRGIARLEATLAVRYEDYSDFGSTTDPKYGLLWAPTDSFKLRGTYGTSFRAPLFRELTEQGNSAFLVNFLPDTSGATPLTLWAFGGNNGLQPETATTWTAGVDIQPTTVPSLTFGLTYFNIEFEGRIASVGPGFDALTNPLFEPIITTNTDPNWDPALNASIAALPNFVNLTAGLDPADAVLLLDSRLRNLSSNDISGFDLSASYSVDTERGTWGFHFSGTYLSEYDSKLLVTSDPIEQLNTVGNPIDLKFRGGVSWSSGGKGANLFVNYVDSYEDDRFDPIVKVDSWTTVDLNLTYETNSNSDGILSDTDFSLNLQNLFDEDPPFVGSFFPDRNVNFDSNAASPLGRFVSLQATKRW